jgi:hypothetical protein
LARLGTEEDRWIGGDKRPEKGIQAHHECHSKVKEDASHKHQHTAPCSRHHQQWKGTFKQDDGPAKCFGNQRMLSQDVSERLIAKPCALDDISDGRAASPRSRSHLDYSSSHVREQCLTANKPEAAGPHERFRWQGKKEQAGKKDGLHLVCAIQARLMSQAREQMDQKYHDHEAS